MFTLLTTLLCSTLQTPLPESEALKRIQSALSEVYKADADRESGRIEEAIRVCRKHLLDPELDRSRFEEKSPEWIRSAQMKATAQHCLAQALESHRDWPEAIQAYADCISKNPMPSTCGNGSPVPSYLVAQGRCLEHLGKHQQALECYFEAVNSSFLTTDAGAAMRIVELYTVAGRLDVLENKLDQIDEAYVAQFKKPPVHPASRGARTERIRDSMRLFKAEKEGRWDVLAAEVRTGRFSLVGIERQAVQQLIRHPDIAVPLLKDQLVEDGRTSLSVAYVLGVCGGNEAVSALKSAALREHSAAKYTILNALDLAGEPGRRALRELSESNDDLKYSIQDIYGKGRRYHEFSPAFPSLPQDLKLD